MITGAKVWLVNGSNREYDCDNVVFDPHCGYLKLYIKGDVYMLFAQGAWSHVEIRRSGTSG